VQPADTLADKHMDIEAGSPTNVDIFYLFSAMPFLIRSFTSIPCMALESAKMDKRRMDRHKRSMDTNSPSRKPCRATRNPCMVVHIYTSDMPTTILEATET
jgi:hypothetical protein